LEYIPPRQTFTPPIDQPLVFNMDRLEEIKLKFGHSKSNNTSARSSSNNSSSIINNTSLNKRVALAFISNKKTKDLKISNFSFDSDNVKRFNEASIEEKKEQKLVDQMKNEALLRRLKYQSNLEKDFEERTSLCREKLYMESHLLHNFRTKKHMRNKKH
jgi:hypothetical protein